MFLFSYFVTISEINSQFDINLLSDDYLCSKTFLISPKLKSIYKLKHICQKEMESIVVCSNKIYYAVITKVKDFHLK